MKLSVVLLSLLSFPLYAQVSLNGSEFEIPDQEVILVRTSETPEEVKLLRNEEVFADVCLQNETRMVMSKHPSCGEYSYVANRCSNGNFPASGCGNDGIAYDTIETDYYECKHEEVVCLKSEKVSRGFERITYKLVFEKLAPLSKGVTEEFLISGKKLKVIKGTRKYKTDYFYNTFVVQKKFLGLF